MYQTGARAGLRGFQSFRSQLRPVVGRRFLTTEPPHLRSRSWKSSALRWGLAVGGIYYYNTSPVFAQQPQHNLLNPNVEAIHNETNSSTIEALTASSQNKEQRHASVLQSAVESASNTDASERYMIDSQDISTTTDTPPVSGSVAELEEEAEGEGAFNPVTGEINWDCPCLGGMAYGPCGPEFKEAFSCFVYSKEEPKGMECIDKFQAMQTCFRAHPEVYKGELEDEEELDESLAQEKEELQKEIAERRAAVEAKQGDGSTSAIKQTGKSAGENGSSKQDEASDSKKTSKANNKSGRKDESSKKSKASDSKDTRITSNSDSQPEGKTTTADVDSLVPKASHDAR